MFDLCGKFAVVTGAGSGIGEAIARGFTGAGAAVFVLDHDGVAAKRVAESLPNAKTVAADVSDENSVTKAVGVVLEQSGGQIDVLVNNAGIGHVGTVLTTTPADLDRLYRVIEAQRLAQTHEALVHGDFSPKNMLISGDRMIVLDCEVAWYGDPSFDVGFLLNHLLLKSVIRAGGHSALRESIKRFQLAYSEQRADASAVTLVCRRLGRLLPMLLLARVDGKSPVEYLDALRKQWIRGFMYNALWPEPQDFEAIVNDFFTQLGRTDFGE